MDDVIFDAPAVVTPERVSKRARGSPEKTAELPAEVNPRDAAAEVNPGVDPLSEVTDVMVVTGGFVGAKDMVLHLENVKGVRVFHYASNSTECCRLFSGRPRSSLPLANLPFSRRFVDALKTARKARALADPKLRHQTTIHQEDSESDVDFPEDGKRGNPRLGGRGFHGSGNTGIIQISLPRDLEDEGAHGETCQEIII